MASRNGLNPKIRGPKGVGWGRALPAAFGFDNGIFPNGTNGYMTVPGLIGKPLPNQFTIEFWAEFPETVNDLGGIFRFVATGDNTVIISRADAPLTISSDVADQGSGLSFTLPSDTRKGSMAIAIEMSSGNTSFYSPNTLPANLVKSNLTSIASSNIEKFEFFTSGNYTTQNGNIGIDEFRMYNKIITNDQFILNYNNGIGNNPFETESLLVWYKFEKFETLDFSALQDGSDMRLGIRDLSGHNNHAQPFNMDTNPTSGTYVLKPF